MSDVFADADYVRDELESRGPEIAVREPRPGDPLIDRGNRLTVLAYDHETALIRFEDTEGFALHRARSTVWWDGSAWRVWGGER